MNAEELAQRRGERALEADRLLRSLFAAALGPFPEHVAGSDPRSGNGMALVAVGGYGRSELSPHSDLDVVLLHDPSIGDDLVNEVANSIWYPLWDRGVALDHSVRDTKQMREAAVQDYRAATGMLDARPVAGDSGLVLTLRSQVLADWRRDARNRLGEVREARISRIERAGWIAHSAIPDLKESGGGLRDGALLRALVATWLVDVPHVEAEVLRHQLLDVRDRLHEVTGKRGDKMTPEVLPDVAALMGMGAEELDFYVRNLGRRTSHLCSLVWRRIDDVMAPTTVQSRLKRRAGGGPQLDSIAPGVALLDREVVLTIAADPSKDAELSLRVAYEAANRKLAVSEASAGRMATEMVAPTEPWPRSANRLMVNLLASGQGLVSVWDELDYDGVIDTWLPEWSAIRLRGSSSPVHRFTVDRHSIETCVQVKSHLRVVSRPDLLVVAALLHDIGKGAEGDHSDVGAPMAEAIALRWGFSANDAARIGHLVRWHLLLPTVATRRDIEDPSTAANVAEIVGDADSLELLAALTESDARSTSNTAWSPWRAGLIKGLVEKTRAVLQEGVKTPDPENYEGWPEDFDPPSALNENDSLRGREFSLEVRNHHTGSRIIISTPDRSGSMADMAAGIALAGLEVLSARAVTTDMTATTLWEVTRDDVDAKKLTERIKSVVDGTLDLDARLKLTPTEDAVDTTVRVLEGLSETATLIEVRAQDRRGLVWAVSRAIATEGVSIRSAHLSTYGPEARDVFYVVDAGGQSLSPESAKRLTERVAAALS
ncbi:MAG: [protein-PII] uridylyltransferase [Kineosporiaceae bacterium]|nr:[protein-PII] uridylyltransferase [Aeromicrobium sp.]